MGLQSATVTRKGSKCYSCNEDIKKGEWHVYMRFYNVSRRYHTDCLREFCDSTDNMKSVK